METSSTKIRIGDLMVAAGYIDEAQLADALQTQKESQGDKSITCAKNIIR